MSKKDWWNFWRNFPNSFLTHQRSHYSYKTNHSSRSVMFPLQVLGISLPSESNSKPREINFLWDLEMKITKLNGTTAYFGFHKWVNTTTQLLPIERYNGWIILGATYLFPDCTCAIYAGDWSTKYVLGVWWETRNNCVDVPYCLLTLNTECLLCVSRGGRDA